MQRLRCKLQSGRTGRQTGTVDIKGLGVDIKYCSCPVHNEGRALLHSARAAERIAECEAFRRQGKAIIHRRERTPQLAVAHAAEVDVHFKKPLSLVGGEHARVGIRSGDAIIRRAENDEMLYIAPSHAVCFAGSDAVERNGDRTDIVARENQSKESAEVFGIGLRVTEDGRALLERRDRYIPKPGTFARLGIAVRGCKLIGSLLQALRKTELVKKRGERTGLLRCGERGARTL